MAKHFHKALLKALKVLEQKKVVLKMVKRNTPKINKK